MHPWKKNTAARAIRVVRLAGFGVATLLFLVPKAAAQNDALPDAAKILDRYVEVTGGADAYKEIRNRVSKGTLEIVGQGIKLDLEIYSARPNLFYRRVESDVTGVGEAGFDGRTAWEVSTHGARIIEGEERDFMARGAQFDSTENWRAQFKNAECVGRETIEGKDCYKIVLTPRAGKPTTRYFDVESGLIVKSTMVIASQMGDLELESYPGDWREIDGIKLPHKSRQVIPAVSQERVFTLESVKHNVDLPADRFKLPEPIRELVQKAGEGKPTDRKTP
ncbi:MAG: hypothetical protein D6744_04435 [Planctomycetota bacterium]|nr:MAG: hypothetical protein D6744_04435 [Planctomycetota bacterium]